MLSVGVQVVVDAPGCCLERGTLLSFQFKECDQTEKKLNMKKTCQENSR